MNNTSDNGIVLIAIFIVLTSIAITHMAYQALTSEPTMGGWIIMIVQIVLGIAGVVASTVGALS